MENILKIRAVSAPWNNGVEFLIRCGNAVAEPLIMKQHEENTVAEPTFRLDREYAQLLMDDLWVAGIRPTEGTGSAGALAATQKHLEDMRTLVFKNKA